MAAPPSCLLWGDPILMIVFREYEIVSVQSLISGWEMLHAVPTYLGIIKIVPDRNRCSLGWRRGNGLDYARAYLGDTRPVSVTMTR